MPDPPPARVVLGLTGSELVPSASFQYASRFLWDAPGLVDWLRRNRAEDISAEHVERFLDGQIGRVWYAFGQRDALRDGLLDVLRERLGLFPLAAPQRAYRAEVARGVREFALAADGYVPTEEPRETIAQRLEERPGSVRVPRELERWPADERFEELRAIAALLAARGCRLAIAEAPVSPYQAQHDPVLHGAGFRERMSELARELEIVWVPMAPEETSLDNFAFRDVNHLTPSGARRYTRMLFLGLDEHGLFAEPAR